MSLLKRLNAENSAAGAAPAAPGNTKPVTGPVPQSGALGTGELFTKATSGMTPPSATGDLFQNPPPRQTTALAEQTQQAQQSGRSRASAKQDSFNEIKVR